MIIKRKKDIKQDSVDKQPLSKKPEVKPKEEEEFNFDDLDFSQRAERRRGNRRRGYRRIDDRNLVSRAQAEAMSIKEESIKDGYSEGVKQAQADISDFRHELKKFMGLKDKVVEEISHDVLEIALDIASKIIKKEIEKDYTSLILVIQDVLSKVARTESKITIKVSPEDVGYIKDNIDGILSNLDIDAKMLVKADKRIELGGVIVETSNGIVDATFETQLEVIKEAFKVI